MIFPFVAVVLAPKQSILKNITGHNYSSAFYSYVWFAIVCVRRAPIACGTHMNGNNLKAQTMWHVNVFYRQSIRGSSFAISLAISFRVLSVTSWPRICKVVGEMPKSSQPPAVLRKAQIERMPSFSSPVVFFSSNVRVSSPDINDCISSIFINSYWYKNRHKNTNFFSKSGRFEVITIEIKYQVFSY